MLVPCWVRSFSTQSTGARMVLRRRQMMSLFVSDLCSSPAGKAAVLGSAVRTDCVFPDSLRFKNFSA